MTSLERKADSLLTAHRGDRPLVLPNVWDVASARVVEEAGFPIVATSSRAIAAVFGLDDNDSSGADVIFDHLHRIAAAVDCPVTADLEAGYRLPAAELVDRMLAAGVVGCNLEDTDHHGDGVLIDAQRHASYLASVHEAALTSGVHVVINARIDCFIRQLGSEDEQLAEGIRRATQYFEAGADCVYPIALVDRTRIARFVASMNGPVNAQARRDGLGLDELTKLGVRRVSLASGLFNLGNDHLRMAVRQLAEGGLAALWATSPRA